MDPAQNPGQPAGDPPKDPDTTPSTPPPAAPAPPATGQPDAKKDDEPLGENGLKALQAEREARKNLEKQVEALAPLQKLAEVLGVDKDPGDGKSQVDEIAERMAKYEETLADERAARFRAEVARDFQFTDEQAAELRGATREELVAHAERLQKLFPAAEPKWGPSDGGPRGTQPKDLTQQIQDAESKGDWRTARALKSQQLAAAKTTN